MSDLRKLTEDELANSSMESRLLNAAVRELLYRAERQPGFSGLDRAELQRLRHFLNGEEVLPA